MKRLLFIRHAKSDWSDGTLADFDRPLNKRGRHDAPLMAQLLNERGIAPSFLMSSPANRAYTTARLFAKELGIAESDIGTDRQLYESHTHELLDAVARLPSHHDCAAIFSHNPGLTSAVSQFSDHYIGNVPTCGIGVIETAEGTWESLSKLGGTLAELLFPKAVLKAYA